MQIYMERDLIVCTQILYRRVPVAVRLCGNEGGLFIVYIYRIHIQRYKHRGIYEYTHTDMRFATLFIAVAYSWCPWPYDSVATREGQI